jgi:hypothetical protein
VSKSPAIATHGRRWLVANACVTILAIFAVLEFRGYSQASSSQPGQMVVGALGSLERVGLSGKISTSPNVQIYAARGEYDGFQIAVDARNGPIESVSVAFPGLRSTDDFIGQSNLTVYREHYVRVDRSSPDIRGSNRPQPPGLYPDALIPLNSSGRSGGRARFRAGVPILAPGTRAVYWVDVFVPREAHPGTYSGELTVSSKSEATKVPVSLLVWHHTLPLRPSLKSSFGIDRSRMADTRMAELLLEHHLMPFLIDPGRSADYQRRFGLNSTGLWFFGDANVRNCTMNPAPSVEAIRAAMARYPADVDKYVYAADEIDPCPAMFPTLKQWARNVHKAGAKMLVTVTPTNELLDDGSGTGRSAVDVWVLLPKMYSKARALVRQVLNKGDEVWSYNALVQDADSPKWEIDFSPVDYRIQPGFLSQSLGLTGLLYSKVDSWNDDPWTNAISLEESGYTFPGEDMLVYPGADAGIDRPLPSMRLKWLREGIEDYEYVAPLHLLIVHTSTIPRNRAAEQWGSCDAYT